MGNVIEFYRPAKRKPAPQAAAPVEEECAWLPTPAADVLAGIDPADISELVILTRDKNGDLGLISNLQGMAENILFIEQVKAEMIKPRPEPPTPPLRSA